MRAASFQFSRILLLLAVFFASGSQWAILQTVAWSTMLYDFSRHDSLSQAVVKTFDGNHPCQICKEVQRGQTQGGEKSSPTKLLKVELFWEVSAAWVMPRLAAAFHEKSGEMAKSRGLDPETPPPRAA